MPSKKKGRNKKKNNKQQNTKRKNKSATTTTTATTTPDPAVISELCTLLSVDAPTATNYYTESKGDVTVAVKQYFERTGRRPVSITTTNLSKTAAHNNPSPRLLNRPSQLNLTGEDGVDGMPMTISFRVKSVEEEEDKEEEGYSSDSSGVGLITPRHQHRPAPLFDVGDLGGGTDALPSCSSKTDVVRGDSFRSTTAHPSSVSIDCLDEMEGVQYVADEFDSDNSSDHDHDNEYDEDAYSSDSSGVGLITPRHQHRPPPLFNEHDSDDEGVDPMPSVKSRGDCRSVESFHESAGPRTTASAATSTPATTSMDVTKQALRTAKEEVRHLSDTVAQQLDIIEECDLNIDTLTEQLTALRSQNANLLLDNQQLTKQTHMQHEMQEEVVLKIEEKHHTQLYKQQHLNTQMNEKYQEMQEQMQQQLTINRRLQQDMQQERAANGSSSSSSSSSNSSSNNSTLDHSSNTDSAAMERQLTRSNELLLSELEGCWKENNRMAEMYTLKLTENNTLVEENNKCTTKLGEYEQVLVAQSSHQGEQMEMIRMLRERTKLLIGQVTFERSMRLNAQWQQPKTRQQVQAHREQKRRQLDQESRRRQQERGGW